MFINVTITGNSGATGGIWADAETTLVNTIIVGNSSIHPTSKAPDCRTSNILSLISGNHNLIGNIGWDQLGQNYTCDADWASGDLIGQGTSAISLSRVLGPRVNAGNGVTVFPLKLGSPALESGNPAPPGVGGFGCPATDQLGNARPQGAYCDQGAVEFQFEVYPPNSLLVTYTANNKRILPGTKICEGNNSACSSADVQAKSLHQFAYSAYDHYKAWYGRNSLDDNNLSIVSVAHYGNNYPNAFWNGYMLVFGDGHGFALADDVVAHEYTHGVTQFESNLFYWYQSGAINESFSDLWGEAVDQANHLGNDADSVKWLIGEDISGLGAIRNMSDPTDFYDPDSMTSPLYCKSGICLDDNGGVRTNSGVNNKAAFLMVNGGAFNGQTVDALGWTKTLAIYYEAQVNLLVAGSDYFDLYNVLYQACVNLVGSNGIVMADCKEVRDATRAVNMNAEPATNFNPNAPYCPPETWRFSRDLFYENFETGVDGWTIDKLYGPLDEIAWSLSTENATSGISSLWADDSYERNGSYAETPRIYLPAGSKSYLHFSHTYKFEVAGSSYYDGGVLDYALDYSNNWVDAKSLFSAGQNYVGKLAIGLSNPIEGRDAFAGDSHGFVESRYDLTSFAGKYIRFRWQMGTNTSDSILGWYLDDVRVYRCVRLPSIPILKMPANQSTTSDFTPKFDWSNSSPDLHHYELQIAKNSAFTQGVVKYNDISVSIFTPTTALTPGTYYWRVRAYNAAGKASAWSTVWKFTIQ
jgi:hypothetical protein